MTEIIKIELPKRLASLIEKDVVKKIIVKKDQRTIIIKIVDQVSNDIVVSVE